MHPVRLLRGHVGLALTALVFGAPILPAQVLFNGTSAYTENFNSLPRSGATFTFEDNTTLPGWFTSLTNNTPNNAYVSTGASNTLASSGTVIYSWGSADNVDRALGIFTRTSNATTSHIALQLQNTSGGVIDSITITFDVEQWRRNTGGGALGFSYLTTTSNEDRSKSSVGFTTVAEGAVTNFATSGSGGGANGNSLSQTVSFALTGLNWQNNEYLWLRWSIIDSVSTGAGIGIDNVTIAPAAIPEPASTAVLLGTGGLIMATASRRR